MNRGTSQEHIDQVIHIDDRVLRNYWVTQTYADLSTGLAALLDPATANWCTFGTWASWTVGGNMRGEALPAWLHDRVLLPDGLMGAAAATTAAHGWGRVRHALRDLEPDHMLDVIRALLGEMAINLSDGNTEVFAEIAPPASAFISSYGAARVDRSAARAQVLALCDGAPPFEGVNRLHAGYSMWCDAMESTDAATRSQLILAGSLQLGVHEQNHLQPVIASSMDMGINQSLSRLKQKITTDAAALAKVDHEVDEALRPAAHAIGDAWDDLMTLTLGTLQSPEGTMRLDHDVPVVPDQPFEPPDLSPVVVTELATLRNRFDRSKSGGKESRAIDWANFDDRMNFIANLFISRHHQTALFAEPFDDETLSDMEADRIPSPRAPKGAK
jgi:hypothetical protein